MDLLFSYFPDFFFMQKRATTVINMNTSMPTIKTVISFVINEGNKNKLTYFLSQHKLSNSNTMNLITL